MGQARKLREWEVRWARAFLAAMHANEANGYLLRAVVAWMRVEGGGRYNPLNLTGAGGRLLSYRSLYASAQASARRVQNPTARDSGFRLIRITSTRGAAGNAAMVEQARDFLQAIALSSWDEGHYGMVERYRTSRRAGAPMRTRLDKDSPEKNRIVAVWSILTGMSIPDKWFIDGVTKPAPPPPPLKQPFRQPRSGLGFLPEAERLDGYAILRFYEERKHAGEYVLVD